MTVGLMLVGLFLVGILSVGLMLVGQNSRHHLALVIHLFTPASRLNKLKNSKAWNQCFLVDARNLTIMLIFS